MASKKIYVSISQYYLDLGLTFGNHFGAPFGGQNAFEAAFVVFHPNRCLVKRLQVWSTVSSDILLSACWVGWLANAWPVSLFSCKIYSWKGYFKGTSVQITLQMWHKFLKGTGLWMRKNLWRMGTRTIKESYTEACWMKTRRPMLRLGKWRNVKDSHLHQVARSSWGKMWGQDWHSCNFC